MPSLDTYLWNFVQSIEPTQTQKEAAARSHTFLRDVLVNSGQFGQRILTSYLSGSYSRDTAIRPIDDVDVVFVINPSYWPSFPSNLPSPSRVLDSFAGAIRYRYPVSSVFGQRRSVRLQLFHLDIDVVPAVNSDQSGVDIYIPDERGSWIKTSPRKHAEQATQVNKVHSGRFKPLVKLLKFWNSKLPTTSQLKSFAIETIATRLFMQVQTQALDEGMLLFFDFISYLAGKPSQYQWGSNYGMALSWTSAHVPDVTGANVLEGLELGVAARFVENTTMSRDRMLDARAATSLGHGVERLRVALRI